MEILREIDWFFLAFFQKKLWQLRNVGIQTVYVRLTAVVLLLLSCVGGMVLEVAEPVLDKVTLFFMFTSTSCVMAICASTFKSVQVEYRGGDGEKFRKETGMFKSLNKNIDEMRPLMLAVLFSSVIILHWYEAGSVALFTVILFLESCG